MNKPNFFIVGFGRSGSTSLYKYLRDHPEIYMSPVKEPKFFCSDMIEGSKTSGVKTLPEYLALFELAANEKVLGEASTMYILSDIAAREIHEFNPDSKIVILLRHPVDFLQSWHSLGVRDGYESEPDLLKALDLEDERTRVGGSADHGAEISYRYRHVIKSAPQRVQRWYDTFGRDRVKLIVFDDLSKKTEATYRDLLAFLDVDTETLPDFKVHNSAKAFGKSRSGWLRELRRWLPKRTFGLRKILKALDTTQVQRGVLPPETRQALVDEFTPVIKELERIVRRDLSEWYRS